MVSHYGAFPTLMGLLYGSISAYLSKTNRKGIQSASRNYRHLDNVRDVNSTVNIENNPKMKKLSVEIPEELLFKLNKLLDWGTRGEVYRQLTIILIAALEADSGFAQDLIDGRVTFIDT